MSKVFDKVFVYPQWFIAYRNQRLFDIPFDTGGFNIIYPPSGRFYADPFVIKHQDKNYIFFEDYSFIKNKGVISFVEIDNNGNHTAAEIVLQKEYHLSYPFLFRWNNQVFMIPETGGNGTVELYAADNFPYDWKLVKVMMKDLIACDTTIWFSEQKIWLFMNQPGCTDLFLFYADTIFDEWIPHPKNPIVSNICGARPAGNLFIHNGDIIRPGQNCANRYGQALVFNKVTCLTEQDYQEEVLGQVDSSWLPSNISFHTYNFNEDLEVIDGELIRTDIRKPYIKLASIFFDMISRRFAL